jgi:hypothetical protein
MITKSVSSHVRDPLILGNCGYIADDVDYYKVVQI